MFLNGSPRNEFGVSVLSIERLLLNRSKYCPEYWFKRKIYHRSNTTMPNKSSARLIEACILVSLVAYILFLRKPDAFLNPQLWAEDGPIFLVQQREQGGGALFNEYAGYYLIVPRLIALLSAPISLEHIPTVYNFSALLCTVATSLLILFSRVDLGVPKLLLAISIVLIPNSGEIFANVTNVQWFLAAVIPFLILQCPPVSWKQGLFDGCVVLFIGLTGPFLILSMPLLIWRVIKHWKPKIIELPFYACAGVALFLQAYSLLIHHQQSQGNGFVLKEWLKVCFLKFGSYLYFGKQLPESMPQFLAICAACFLLLTLWGLFLLREEKQQAILVFLTFGLLIFLASLSKASHTVGQIVLIFHPFMAGGRYYFLPFLFLFYTYLIFSYSSPQQLKWIGFTGTILILLSSATAFSGPPLPDFHWKTRIKQLETSSPVEIEIPPGAGWKVKLRPK